MLYQGSAVDCVLKCTGKSLFGFLCSLAVLGHQSLSLFNFHSTCYYIVQEKKTCADACHFLGIFL